MSNKKIRDELIIELTELDGLGEIADFILAREAALREELERMKEANKKMFTWISKNSEHSTYCGDNAVGDGARCTCGLAKVLSDIKEALTPKEKP